MDESRCRTSARRLSRSRARRLAVSRLGSRRLLARVPTPERTQASFCRGSPSAQVGRRLRVVVPTWRALPGTIRALEDATGRAQRTTRMMLVGSMIVRGPVAKCRRRRSRARNRGCDLAHRRRRAPVRRSSAGCCRASSTGARPGPAWLAGAPNGAVRRRRMAGWRPRAAGAEGRAFRRSGDYRDVRSLRLAPSAGCRLVEVAVRPRRTTGSPALPAHLTWWRSAPDSLFVEGVKPRPLLLAPPTSRERRGRAAYRRIERDQWLGCWCDQGIKPCTVLGLLTTSRR